MLPPLLLPWCCPPARRRPPRSPLPHQAAAHKALVVAQLIVMANNLRAGGTLVMRLSMHPDNFTMGVLALLRCVFEGDVHAYKPRSCHVHRASYYVVAKGFMPAKAHQHDVRGGAQRAGFARVWCIVLGQTPKTG